MALVEAEAQTAAQFETAAKQAILMDSGSGKVLFEKNADELMHPASMSKIMTMIMVFERLESGRLSLDDEFVVSENAWRRGGATSGGSTMYAELNSRVKLRDLIKGVIVQSGNDACIVIAEGIAGSEGAFADLMTQRARELGLERSTFKNATGLTDPEHQMTARELALLARYLIEVFPEFYKTYSIPEFTWNGITQPNRNPLLGSYPGADGIKTGYVAAAGYGLTGSAKRDGRRLIMVINGLGSVRERAAEAQKLLDWGFRQYRTVELYQAGQRVGQARVWGGSQRWIDLVARDDVRLALSDEEKDGTTVEVAYDGPLRAPVKQGEEVGAVRFKVNGRLISESPLVTGQAVGEAAPMWSRAIDSVAYMIFGG
ncbi:MAG TPA: D-alanyl-D-alanine carboxypeptidase family protein [Aestuariivirgaceae bacterium]|nr:D-alanyl-D-alanine carboxypeptidase family protein [Aestuariivirgaceae bacterium]